MKEKIIKLVFGPQKAAQIQHAIQPPDTSVNELKVCLAPEYPIRHIPITAATTTTAADQTKTKSKESLKARRAWTNWAKNQTCHPLKTLQPRTLEDVVEIVKNAKADNNKIRCVAGGYTWSSTSVVDDDGLLVFVNKMTKIYTPVYDESQGWTVELETGVTVGALDKFLQRHDPPLAMPSNIVMETACLGGILALGSVGLLDRHGAATHSRTLSDLACEVKIVDATGTLNTFTRDKDPVEFSAAACNLGLLGVIYSYTLHVEPMFNLIATDTYPPRAHYFDCPKLGGARLKEMILGSDQTHILYWPFNNQFNRETKNHDKVLKQGGRGAIDELWVKQWKRTDLPETKSALWKSIRMVRQHIGSICGNITFEIMSAHPRLTPLVNHLISTKFRSKSEKVLAAPDAIHYQRNLQAAACVGLECVFKVDEGFENPVRALNFAIAKIHEYAERGEFPMNVTLDMRFIKASNQIMSYAYDKDPETIFCTMEMLSAANTKGFEEFAATVAPHWAKLWEHISGIVPYLCEQAEPQLKQFESIRKKYDPNGMFMNKTFAGVLGHS
ncbi:hypothetical protein BGZ89_009320 [Linnemannia elongata]|nr:hypothetical protein BGZ89_009320 [Linnemannia elongata]